MFRIIVLRLRRRNANLTASNARVPGRSARHAANSNFAKVKNRIMRKLIPLLITASWQTAPAAVAQVFFSENFDAVDTAGLVKDGWEISPAAGHKFYRLR